MKKTSGKRHNFSSKLMVRGVGDEAFDLDFGIWILDFLFWDVMGKQ